MLLHQLNNKKETKPSTSKTRNALSDKSDIREGMTTSQIANAISNHLLSHVEKALEDVKVRKKLQ